MQRQCERHQLGCSAARATGGPTAYLEAPLGGAIAAARGSAPGEDREGRLATSRPAGALKCEALDAGLMCP